MANTLVDPNDLAGFPGAPFSDAVVDAAVAQVRRVAGWHIAPAVTETLTVDGSGGAVLMLPTLRLTAVTEVRDVSCADPVVVTGWRLSPEGFLTLVHPRCRWWPCGPRTVEVDVTHGYDECPPDLKPAIAAAARGVATDSRVASQASGPFSVTYRDVNVGPDPALAAYALPSRP